MSDAQSDFPSAAVRAGATGAGLGAADPAPAGYQPLYDLASPQQVTGATFFAGPLAGVWLLARNFRRLGRGAAATWTLALGVVATALVFLIAVKLPDRVPAFVISVPMLLVMWRVAVALQGPAFDAHVGRSGPRTTTGRIVLIAILAVVIQAAALVGGAIAYGVLSMPPKVDVGGSHEVYYQDGATADEARRVGEALEAHGYFLPDHPASATVQHPDGAIAVGVVVSADPHDDASFQAVAAAVSHDVFDDQPVEIWLLDDELGVRRRIPWAPPP